MAEQNKEEIKEEIEPKLEEVVAEEEKVSEAEADLSTKQKLQQDLELKNKELEEENNKYQRLYADFDNFRRRSQKEKEEMGILIGEKILQEFLPVMDNFERALSGSQTSDAAALQKGIEMIYKQFNTVFEKIGVEPIDALNQIFDPQYHQAVMREENSDQPDGMIVQELQKGYQYKGRVMRPSMVKVVSNG